MPFALGDLAIDYEQRRVTVAGRRVELTATEYERLRDKLADEADRPALIVNERGVGYRMPRPGDR